MVFHREIRGVVNFSGILGVLNTLFLIFSYMANDGIPKGQPYWALVLGFSVAVAALIYGLWLVSPRELRKYMPAQNRHPAAAIQVVAPAPPTFIPPPPPPPAQ